MKATGIVRRIDELGRIVIPKEIRRSFKFREGDQMEIFTDRDGSVILKKYSPMGEIGIFAKQYSMSVAELVGLDIIITDKDQITAVGGSKYKNLEGRIISRELSELQLERETSDCTDEDIYLVDGTDTKPMAKLAVQHIICDGEVVGTVIIPVTGEPKAPGLDAGTIAKKISSFLATQVEV